MDWRYQILGALTTALVAVLTAAVPLLVRAMIQSIERRLSVNVTIAQEMALTRAAEQGIAFAEEQARKQLARASSTMPSEEKLALASAFVAASLERQGHAVRGVAVDAAVEAALHASR